MSCFFKYQVAIPARAPCAIESYIFRKYFTNWSLSSKILPRNNRLNPRGWKSISGVGAAISVVASLLTFEADIIVREKYPVINVIGYRTYFKTKDSGKLIWSSTWTWICLRKLRTWANAAPSAGTPTLREDIGDTGTKPSVLIWCSNTYTVRYGETYVRYNNSMYWVQQPA